MEPKNRRLQRLLLVVGVVLSLALSTCVTTPQVKVTAEVIDPEQARSRSVAVVADSYMNDAVEADAVAELLRGQLASLGFSLKETEEEADLIVIPTLERSSPTATSRVPFSMRRPFDSSPGVGQAGLIKSQNTMRNLGFEFKTLPEQPEARIGLMVTAITKDVWLNAPLASESEIPRVWRVVAVAPLNKQDMTTKLVEAAGAKLSEIAASPVIEVQPSPPPSPTPKREP